MAKRTQLSYGDADDFRLPEADANDVNSTVERSAEQPWTPTITRDVLDKVQRVVTALPGIVSAQASAAGVMAAFRAADQGAIVPPTPAQVPGAGSGGFGLLDGTGGGVGGALGSLTGAFGSARFLAATIGGILDTLKAPGQARVGDVLSTWQSMQQESLAQQTPTNQALGWAREHQGRVGGAAVGAAIGSVVPGVGTLAGAGIGYLAGSLLDDDGPSTRQQFQRFRRTGSSGDAMTDLAFRAGGASGNANMGFGNFFGGGPNSHGSKSTQGN